MRLRIIFEGKGRKKREDKRQRKNAEIFKAEQSNCPQLWRDHRSSFASGSVALESRTAILRGQRAFAGSSRRRVERSAHPLNIHPVPGFDSKAGGSGNVAEIEYFYANKVLGDVSYDM